MTFISGWAGFRELFGNLSKNIDFYVPFVDFLPDKTQSIISKESELLIGWSMGAHLILKYNQFVKAKKILLLTPFLYFCDYVKKRILDKMITGFNKNKAHVVNEFLRNIGSRNYSGCIPDSLVDGLEFLKSSKVVNFSMKSNYFCVCANKDVLNLSNACNQICEKPILLNSNHYIDEDKIELIIKRIY